MKKVGLAKKNTMKKVGSAKIKITKKVGSSRKETTEKVDLNRTCFEDIPPEVIGNIFSRLPTKTCLNCKLVCKIWYNIITSTEFANQHRSRGCYFSLLLQGRFHSSGIELLLLDLDKAPKISQMGDLSVGDHVKIRFKPKLNYPIPRLQLVNECNGLICLMTFGVWSPFIICNLLTRQQVTVKQSYKESYRVVSCGLGYSSDSRQFKVLRILSSKSKQNRVAEILTVGMGTSMWRSVGDAPLSDLSRAFLKDSLHGYSYEDNCIWSFHFGLEQFCQVPLSDEMNGKKITGLSIFDSGLCCSTYISGNSRACQIWVMKEYGEKDSWEKQFVFDTESSPSRMPLLQLDSGDILVSDSKRREGSCLRVYDDEFKRFKLIMVFAKSCIDVLTYDTMFSNSPMKALVGNTDLKLKNT